MNGESEMMKNAGFVSVKEASEILDVAPNTVRAWGADGKITEYRHPANNYRLYKKAELEKLLKEVDSPIEVKPASKERKKK
jgi:DNA (cytosine-5)-methyltransferase 1